MTPELAALGITNEDLIEKITEKICDRLLDGDGDYRSEFEQKLAQSIHAHVNGKLDKAIEVHIAPKIEEMIDGICLQETNRWGEKRGEKLTFLEFLVQRVDAYIREEVNYKGEPKEHDSYSWRATGTRIQHMVDEHLRHHTDMAMKKCMENATTSVAKGLKEACEIAINNLKVTVNTKVESQI